MDNAGKDGGRVQLHQDGQEDVRKAPFHGQFVPIWPVSAMFSAKKVKPQKICFISGESRISSVRCPFGNQFYYRQF